jgi:hypothetical protein
LLPPGARGTVCFVGGWPHGAILATFEPALTVDQSAELDEVVSDRESADDLATLLEAIADQWGLYLVIDRV